MEHSIQSTPRDIGQGGCAIQNIVAMAKRMLVARKLKKTFWAEAVANAVYILNQCPTKAPMSVTSEETWSGKRPLRCTPACIWKPCIRDGCEFERFNVKRPNCMFLGICEGMEAYRLMYLETKKIIKSKDVVFTEESGSISNDLEMRPSGRNGGQTVLVMDESSKSPLLDDGKQTVDDTVQVGGNEVVIEESSEKLANNDIVDGNSGGMRRYFTRERRPLGEWWKNHILPQDDEVRANVAISEDHLSWNESIRINMKKFMSNLRRTLHRMEKLRKSRALQIFDSLQSGSIGSEA